MKRGFTLIELMVVVVIIGILAAIAIPNFIAMQERGRQSSVKGNMHTTQLSCEAYAVDFNGAYPTGPEPAPGFAYYFPGGDEDVQKTPGKYPKNPYTGNVMVIADFIKHTYAASGDNSDIKLGGANDIQLAAADVGKIRYGIWPGVNPTEYGIIGIRGRDYRSIRSNTILVFHN